ncbi:MAG: integrase, partial [Rhodobacteraceae bacterium]|nr:integrase [Paracoccaceae bacterium]
MIMLRGSTLYLKRAVPKIYASVEPRRVVWASLKTDSRKEAQLRAVEVWRDLVAGWEAMLRGDSGDGETRYLAAQDLARARGFRFLPVERVAKLPLPDMVERIEATMRGGEIDMKLAAGILGTAAKPELTLSGALEAYWPMVVDQIEG